MKKLLILAALAGFGASACGDDSGDKATEVLKDAGLIRDGAVTVRPQQIDTGKVGLACTTANAATTCTGVAGMCLTTEGTAPNTFTFPAGYCSASCQTTAECGANAGCPVAEVLAGLPAAFATIVTPQLLSTFIPSNCFAKCATSADCRGDYTCASIGSLGGGQVPPAAAALLTGPAFMVNYCLPPAPVTDGGVPVVQHDAGTTTTVHGMDGGV
ncbi:MAG: hypothetical protein JWN04_4703 [Myxococcaceae bacterium]|nr:hypothetical protein [Myxococcaceae bacterium]